MDVVVELLPNIPAVNFLPLGTHPRVSSGDNPLTKNPKDSGYEIVLQATQSTQVPDLWLLTIETVKDWKAARATTTQMIRNNMLF